MAYEPNSESTVLPHEWKMANPIWVSSGDDCVGWERQKRIWGLGAEELSTIAVDNVDWGDFGRVKVVHPTVGQCFEVELEKTCGLE